MCVCVCVCVSLECPFLNAPWTLMRAVLCIGVGRVGRWKLVSLGDDASCACLAELTGQK